MTIKQDLLNLGMKEDEFSTWQSDLYVKKTPISTKYLAEYEYKNQVSTFIDNIDHVLWYDIPFGYMEEHYAAKIKGE